MAREEITPSEWQIMEVLWASNAPLTSSEDYKRMQGKVDMSQRMVLLRLLSVYLENACASRGQSPEWKGSLWLTSE